MFRHQGKARTFRHNLRIASLLSFVAGMVNVAGFLAIGRLTTNVTGHFAFLIDEVFRLEFWAGLVYFLYIFFFFLGSFVSNFLIEIVSRRDLSFAFAVPASIEAMLLLFIGIWGDAEPLNANVIAFSLLFSMGLQNSLVTTISNSSVRTTHLTGLFTDLGIELSQLFFYKSTDQRHKLLISIKLRLTIISFFFLGGVAGGISYSKVGLITLCIASTLLIFGLIYDYIKFRLITIRRKFKSD
ncbi:YoaK family protein [Parasegetibacter sp. NRK P23]|uniref:YoaK family protein n=1 Tax=Parasegetibacter sp. NRK P23 TaxID=2942999 RepID=UPI002043AF8B|nr:YoaK family protein [Parasegetibacter sp. NRK P23]MCM5530646.1 DUF1275 domain-containing protein [Parasegetibacter sp. NRK P23]